MKNPVGPLEFIWNDFVANGSFSGRFRQAKMACVAPLFMTLSLSLSLSLPLSVFLLSLLLYSIVACYMSLAPLVAEIPGV